MDKQRTISNLITGFLTGLLFFAVLLSNNTGFSVIDSLNITSLSKEAGKSFETENYVVGKYGSIHTQRSTIRKFLRSHKTKRKRQRATESYIPLPEVSDPYGFVVKTLIKVNFVHSYLLTDFSLRGPPSVSC